MDKLIKLLDGLWDWISWFGRTVWAGFISLVQTIWGKFLIMIGWVWAVLEVVKLLFIWLKDQLLSIINAFIDIPHLPTGATDAFALLNYMVPMSETVVLFAAYLTVILTMMIYRHVKSYIPGPVSGGT